MVIEGSVSLAANQQPQLAVGLRCQVLYDSGCACVLNDACEQSGTMQRLQKEKKIADKFWYDRAKQEMEEDGVSTVACTEVTARSAVTGFSSKTSVCIHAHLWNCWPGPTALTYDFCACISLQTYTFLNTSARICSTGKRTSLSIHSVSWNMQYLRNKLEQLESKLESERMARKRLEQDILAAQVGGQLQSTSNERKPPAAGASEGHAGV
jgi:hypothetical protein